MEERGTGTYSTRIGKTKKNMPVAEDEDEQSYLKLKAPITTD